MLAIPRRAQLALAGDHQIRIRVRVLTDPTAEAVDISASFTGGTAERSRTEIRTSATLTFTSDDATLIPTSPASLLAPYGNELAVDYGIVHNPDDPIDGTDYIPVGILRIVKATITGTSVTVDCMDRAWTVQGNRLEESYSIPAGTAVSAAITSLLVHRYPSAVYDIPTNEYTTPLVVLDAQTDPWAELQALAAASGQQFYPDPNGVFVLRDEPDLATAEPVWTFDATRADNLATSEAAHGWDTDEVHNVWVVTGESADENPPVRGVAWDDDPASPTYAGSPDSPSKFGRRVGFFSTPLVTTGGQAVAAARSRVQAEVGLAESLSLPAAPHPGLEPGDPIKIVDARLGIDQLHQVDRVTLPLSAAGGAQQIDTRVRRTVLGG